MALWVGDIGAEGVVGGRAVRCSASGVERISAMEKVRRHRREVDKDDPGGAVSVEAMNALERACRKVTVTISAPIIERIQKGLLIIFFKVRMGRRRTQKRNARAAGVSRRPRYLSPEVEGAAPAKDVRSGSPSRQSLDTFSLIHSGPTFMTLPWKALKMWRDCTGSVHMIIMDPGRPSAGCRNIYSPALGCSLSVAREY